MKEIDGITTPTGNIQITVLLTPEAWAAVLRAAQRDGLSRTDAINVAVLSLDMISEVADAAGRNLGEAES